MIEDANRAWKRLAAELDSLEREPERAKALCGAYARAVLNMRDPRRLKALGGVRLRRAAEEQLEDRELLAFAMLARAVERGK